jgi:hypothetical protein
MKWIALAGFLALAAALSTPAVAKCTRDAFGNLVCDNSYGFTGGYSSGSTSSRPNPLGGYDYSNGVSSRPKSARWLRLLKW